MAARTDWSLRKKLNSLALNNFFFKFFAIKKNVGKMFLLKKKDSRKILRLQLIFTKFPGRKKFGSLKNKFLNLPGNPGSTKNTSCKLNFYGIFWHEFQNKFYRLKNLKIFSKNVSQAPKKLKKFSTSKSFFKNFFLLIFFFQRWDLKIYNF